MQYILVNENHFRKDEENYRYRKLTENKNLVIFDPSSSSHRKINQKIVFEVFMFFDKNVKLVCCKAMKFAGLQK